MILDKKNLFGENLQHLGGTALFGDQIEFMVTKNLTRNVGAGEQMWLFVLVTVAFTDAGSDSTMTFTLETDNSASMASSVVLLTLPTFAALTAAGTLLLAPLPSSTLYEAFLGLKGTVANGNLTTGSFTAGLTHDPHIWQAYASGYDAI